MKHLIFFQERPSLAIFLSNEIIFTGKGHLLGSKVKKKILIESEVQLNDKLKIVETRRLAEIS